MAAFPPMIDAHCDRVAGRGNPRGGRSMLGGQERIRGWWSCALRCGRIATDDRAITACPGPPPPSPQPPSPQPPPSKRVGEYRAGCRRRSVPGGQAQGGIHPDARRPDLHDHCPLRIGAPSQQQDSGDARHPRETQRHIGPRSCRTRRRRPARRPDHVGGQFRRWCHGGRGFRLGNDRQLRRGGQGQPFTRRTARTAPLGPA